MEPLLKQTSSVLKFILFFSFAILAACDNQSDNSQYAFLSASVEGTDANNAPTTKAVIIRQGKNDLPPEVTRIDFDITDSEGVNTTATLAIGPQTNTINIRVFANRNLVVRVDVYAGDTLAFQGQDNIAALRPGGTSILNIEADPVGGTTPPPPANPQPLPIGFQAIDKLFTPGAFNAYAEDVDIDGNFAYIASRDSGLIIADISDKNNIKAISAVNPFDPTSNRRISEVVVQANLGGGEVSINYAYTINGREMRVLDVSNPLLPVEIASLVFSETVANLTIVGNQAYVHGVPNSSNVFIIDISDPANLRQISTFQALSSISDISVSAQTLYVYSRGQGVQIINVIDPTNPVAEALFPVNIIRSYAIDADNNTLYVEKDLPGNITAVDIVDVSDINNINVLSTITNGRNDIQGLHVFNNSLYLSGNTLSVYDISNKAVPVLIGNVENISFTGNLDVANGSVYIANTDRGLKITELSDLSALVPPTNYLTPGAFTSDVSIQDNFAYVAITDRNNTANNGLHIVNVSDVANPQLVSIVPVTARPSTVKAAGNFVYMIDDASNLHIIDITDPTSPVINSVYPLQGRRTGMSIQGNRVFISSGEVVNVSDPTTPSTITNLNLLTDAVKNNILIASEQTGNNISFFDISDINNPLRISNYASNSKSTNPFQNLATNVTGDFAYIGGDNFNSNSRNSQFNILDLTSITNPGNVAVPGIIGNINNSIETSGLDGSVQHHTFTLTSPITLSFEIGTESFSPSIYLFQATTSGLLQLAGGGGDFNGVSSINNITLPAGNYDLAIGDQGLSPTDAPGSINTDTLNSNASGPYTLSVAPAAKLLGETPIPGAITDITVSGNYAYVRANNNWLYIVDVSDTSSPYITARFKHDNGSNSITTAGDNIFLPDGADGVKIYRSAMDLTIISQTQTSTTVDYSLSWSIDRVSPVAQFNCGVIAGNCTITNVDFIARTANVSWTPSIYSGDYGIVFGLGNEQSTIGTRASINWVTSLGGNPEPEMILVNTFIDAIQANLTAGSIAYLNMQNDKRKNIRIEVDSASFNTHLYLLSSSSNSGFDNFIDNDDFNGALSSIDTSIFAGDYNIGIGNSLLPVSDVTSRSNTNTNTASGNIGNGLFEIRVYELLGDDLIEPGLPATFSRF